MIRVVWGMDRENKTSSFEKHKIKHWCAALISRNWLDAERKTRNACVALVCPAKRRSHGTPVNWLPLRRKQYAPPRRGIMKRRYSLVKTAWGHTLPMSPLRPMDTQGPIFGWESSRPESRPRNCPVLPETAALGPGFRTKYRRWILSCNQIIGFGPKQTPKQCNS